MRAVLFWLCVLLLGVTRAEAATYWVNPASSGSHCVDSATDPGSGSSSQTITQGLACAGAVGTDNGAGDTVIVKDGVYQEELTNVIPNGTSGSPFTLKAQNFRSATLRPTSRGAGMIISMSNTLHYIVIDGLVLDGNNIGAGAGFGNGLGGLSISGNSPYTDMHHITLQNMEIKNTSGSGFETHGHNITITNNYVHDGGNDTVGSSHACYCPLGDSEISHNTFANYVGYGWHPNTQGPGGGTEDHVSENTSFFGNKVSGSGFAAGQWGVLVAGRNIKVYNNLIYGNNAAIIVGHFTAPVNDTITIYNNTIYNNASGGYGGVLIQGGSNVSVRNNIIQSSGRPWDNGFDAPTQFDFNLCDQSISGCSNGNPNFVNAAAGDFRIQASSTLAIDQGVCLAAPYNVDFAGVSRPQSIGCDIGAYEFAPTAPVTRDLRLAMGFETGSGTTATDSSGKNNHGTFAGESVAWDNAGKYGKALHFDGSGGVTVPNSSTLDITGPMTVEAWVYLTVAKSDFNAVVVKNYNSYLYAESPPGVYCGAGAAALAGLNVNATNYVTCDNATLPTNAWVHIAMVYDGVSTLFYRDGILRNTQTSSTVLQSSNGMLTIGLSEFGEYFEGKIDEVRIWNGASSQAQIQGDMAAAIVTGGGGAVPSVDVAPASEIRIGSASYIGVGQ